ncbi:hypothetical protein OV203_22390 [Nannocystis sp. ILAH1]|uniref:hypothetical protein n=1 Tax=unclassified Nannocystis TaxID=2627009 RepID=UPI00226D9329|nr:MULTISPECIES: hypothetical protein [unclassified Nannocystis]MCY0989905.1 hypothetical protein [Nannocystis sp. ILAH1]MCY1071059.1 hypothetical protein [Nannocystis sp. RBIL2]
MRASSLVLVSLFVAACGQPSAYKVIDVPYCKVPDGQLRGGFAEQVRWVYKSGDSFGEGPLAGERMGLGLGVLDSAPSNEMVLALLSCPVGEAADPTPMQNGGKELTASKVPEVCRDQQTLYHGTLKAVDDPKAKERGYAGVFHFPEVALTCQTGTLTRTTSAEIEPRPK